MSILRAILTFIAALYTLGLIAYLLLRVLFSDRFWWLALANNFAPFFFLPLVALLVLAVLLRARRTVFLLPFALVGALWFGPYYLPKSVVASGGQTARVLTFNVWGNNHDLSQIETWLREVNPDLVLLQEISPAYAQETLPNLLDVYPYQFAQEDTTRWGGNIVLSHYPIVEQGFLDLEGDGTPTQQRLVLDINGQPVAVYNVHLAFPARAPRFALPVDSFYARTALGYDAGLRNAQIRGLLAALENEPYPFIVGGDFNTSDQSRFMVSWRRR